MPWLHPHLARSTPCRRRAQAPQPSQATLSCGCDTWHSPVYKVNSRLLICGSQLAIQLHARGNHCIFPYIPYIFRLFILWHYVLKNNLFSPTTSISYHFLIRMGVWGMEVFSGGVPDRDASQRLPMRCRNKICIGHEGRLRSM